VSVIERAVVELGLDVDPKAKKELQSFDDSLDSLLTGVTALGAAFGALTGLIFGTATVTNQATSEMNSLAESVDVSLGFLQAMGAEAKQIGLGTDNVVDLVEEMNNKFGEFRGLGEMTAVSESLKILQLDFKALDKLNPEQQFIKIFDAAKNLGDQQKAVSAVDMLMGGEANKLLGHLRNIDGAMLDIIDRRLQLNFLTEEGTRGAIAFTESLGFLVESAKSMWQQFSGLLGAALLPLIKWIESWIKANRELIQQKIKEWAESFGRLIAWLVPKISWLVSKLFGLFEMIGRVIDRLGGFENAAKLLGAAIAAMGILKAIRLITLFGNRAVGAQLKLFAWIALIALIILAFEDLFLFLEDPNADTMTRRLLEAFEEWAGLDLIEPIREAWPAVKDFFAGLWDGFKTTVALIIETLGSLVMFIIEAFDIGIGKAWDNLLERISTSWHDLWPGLFTFFEESIIQPIGRAFDWVMEKLNAIARFHTDTLAQLPVVGGFFERGGVTEAASAAAAGASNVNTNITVNAQTGASATDIARSVGDVVAEQMAIAKRANSTGVER
jgi:hypothetical protein